jgi:exopolysaccharide biosynthesis polyprenyl glycosylphosphotransferase
MSLGISEEQGELSGTRGGTHLIPLRITERRIILLVGDLLLLNLATLAALWLGAERSRWYFTTVFLLENVYWFIGLSLLYAILAWANDGYSLKVASRPLTSVFALGKALVELLLVYAVVYFVSKPASLPRHIVGFFVVIFSPTLFLWRWAYSVVLTRPTFRQKVLVVGASWAGRTIAGVIQENSTAEYELVGFVDDDPDKQAQTIAGAPVLGQVSDLLHLARAHKVNEIIPAITHDVPGHVLQALLDCHEQGIHVHSMPLLYEELTERVPVEHVGNNWLVVLPLEQNGLLRPYALSRRAMDLALAALGLALFALLLPFLTLAIYIDLPGSIFYRQLRVGQGGRLFWLIKLRSMVPDAESEGGARWAEEYDRRVTRVGRFLRRTRLDEVPQLLNVLRGEMSLVGPRPERPEFVAQLQREIPFYRTRLAVRPGLTGWAQIKYPYARSMEDALIKLQYDLYYIKHQSLWLDLAILLKTFGVILRMRGS